MSRQVDVIEHCRSAIKELLQEHVRYPLFNMREEDFRSSLLQKLRARIKDQVRIRLKKAKDRTPLKIAQIRREMATTSRVHSEVRIRENNNKRRPTFDIVVLKNKKVTFRVSQSVTDVLEQIELKDVAVVIEMKAAPSNMQHPKIMGDAKKLKGLSRARPDLWRILVVIDKSLPLGLASYEKNPNWKWLEAPRARRAKRDDVEIWFFDKNGKVRRCVA